ncbi:MAG: 2-oxoacid:acceptor oxidoreductase subunit alpha, partial [Microvirga sp.]
RHGVIYFGSTAPAIREAMATLGSRGIDLDMLRVRAFPFADEVIDFILAHDQVFVVEQNRDAQLKALLINEGAIDPARLISVLHYDGTPITARFIIDEVSRRWALLTGAPRKEAAE